MTTLLDKIKSRDSKIVVLAADYYTDFKDIISGANLWILHNGEHQVKIDAYAAMTPEEALKMAKEKNPDFIITDPHYEQGCHTVTSGIKFMKTLRTEGFRGIIIAHCADPYQHYISLESGADNFIHDKDYSGAYLGYDIYKALDYFLKREV